jgi:IS5 family transposase
MKEAGRHVLKLSQNYNREAPLLASQIGRYAHAKQYKWMNKARRTLRSRVGRVMWDVERQFGQVSERGRAGLEELIAKTKRILTQRQKDKSKLYAVHAPEAECISKGKMRQPYEFGVKVSITTTLGRGWWWARGRCRPGHAGEALEQAAILSDVKTEVAAVERGYRGAAMPGVKIYHPGLRRGITRTLRAMIKRRSAIELAIGHRRQKANWGGTG